MSLTNTIMLVTVVVVLVGAIAGVFFRAAASAWKSEHEAERLKSRRLAAEVAEQKTEIARLRDRVAELERRPTVEALAAQSTKEHREIVAVLQDLQREVAANTAATEQLANTIREGASSS